MKFHKSSLLATRSAFLTSFVFSITLCQLVAGLAIDTGQQTQVQQLIPQQTDFQIAQHDSRRPLWALAHMVNSIKELDYRLSKGANAVEVDVTFGAQGDPLYTYHGPPCDCWRHCHQQEDFNEYISYVREVAIDETNGVGKNLTILFLDLKLDYLDQKAKARAGRELAKSVVSNLFLDSDASKMSPDSIAKQPNDPVREGPKAKRLLRLIISVNHVSDATLVQNFIQYMEQTNSSHLMQRIGFDVGMNDELSEIESMWRSFGSQPLNLWQGDGFTNCFSPFYNLARLSKALLKRDSATGYPRKVYHWTIDLHDRMRESLKLGVDAIMTNHPERLMTVLREPEIAHEYRLATSDDDPFIKIMRRSTSRTSESARYQRTSSGFFANLMDVLQSWFNYIKEIPFLSLPTTTRFFRATRKQSKSLANLTEINQQNNQPEYRIELNQTSDSPLVPRSNDLQAAGEANQGLVSGASASVSDGQASEADKSQVQ